MFPSLALHHQCVELPLEFLTPAEVAQYLVARCGVPTGPAALSQALYRRTDGHPLFLVTMVDALVQQELLQKAAGQWVLTGDLAAVQALVLENLRALIGQQV